MKWAFRHIHEYYSPQNISTILCAMLLCSIAHSIICTRLFRGKMHSDWFSGIEPLQGRRQHGEKVGYCYPSGLGKTLRKWDMYVPLVMKGLINKFNSDMLIVQQYASSRCFECSTNWNLIIKTELWMTNCVLFSFYNFIFGCINLITVTSSEVHKRKCPSYVHVKQSRLRYNTACQSSAPLNVQFILNLT
jgi:hypothetical protein